MDEFDCRLTGAEFEQIRDRVFAVCRENGNALTARTYPRMVLISPNINDHIMTLTAPGMEQIQIDISQLYASPLTKKIKVWDDTVDVVDCGDEVGNWFSKFILGEKSGLRLVFYPSKYPKSEVTPRKEPYRTAEVKDMGSLHDETSFMIMNQGSFDELNTRIEKPVGPLQYRPNFVVNGPGAFEEDSWKWIRIGNEATFQIVQPCTRCTLTNIDPATGVRNPKEEPLKTLKQFRTFTKSGPSPVFGQHLGVRQQGTVRMNDAVYVGEN